MEMGEDISVLTPPIPEQISIRASMCELQAPNTLGVSTAGERCPQGSNYKTLILEPAYNEGLVSKALHRL